MRLSFTTNSINSQTRLTAPQHLRNRQLHRRGVRSRRGGVVFIEFALIFPVFVFLLLGVLQYARLIQATEIVTNLSRDGARYGSLGPNRTDAQITSYIQQQILQTSLSPIDFTYTITPAESGRVEGSQIRVALTYNLKSRIFLPATSFLLNAYRKNGGDPIYEANAIMRIVNAY